MKSAPIDRMNPAWYAAQHNDIGPMVLATGGPPFSGPSREDEPVAFALSEQVTNLVLIVCPTYKRAQRIAWRRDLLPDEWIWMASRRIAERWVDRCLALGARTEFTWAFD